MKVYRYFNFERLKEVIESKKLYFVNPFVKWSDTKEGVLYRLAQNASDLVVIEKILCGNRYKKQLMEQLQNGSLFKKNDGNVLDWFGMRCQSWSMSRNSAEMWENYSYDNRAVCIAVDVPKLLSLHSKNQKVEGFSVNYKSEIDVSEELKQVLGKGGEFYFPFILRSKLKEQFGFENEYRLYVLQSDSEGHFEENHDGVFVDIDYKIDEFIDEVLVHPNAPDDFVNLVKEYVAKYNIHFSR